MQTINPKEVLYIKLGKEGMWERECIEKENTLKLGYNEVPHDLCVKGEWEKVQEECLKFHKKSAAKRDVQQIRCFYEADESVLWITFYQNKLCWCFSKPEVTLQDDGTKTRPVIEKWKCEDIEGEPLLFDRLSGDILSLQAFRGTICRVDKSEYVINKINAEKSEEIKEAETALKNLEEKLKTIIQRLHWKDFETLTDLIFRQAGWKRVSLLGDQQRGFDLDLLCPITGNRYLVQVKSKASEKDLTEFQNKFKSSKNDYTKFYFVVHSPTQDLEDTKQNGDFKLILVQDIAKWAVQLGLAEWVIKKTP